ncbi:MAG: GNAT family N-acetyltransferase [Actinobacteria bacterium]|nr:GNAT family N-acetyltransferase [Actinomycetota bacterium]
MIVRQASTDADFALWTRARNLVEPEAPSTVDDLRRGLRQQPETRHWLAEEEGKVVGCVFAAISSAVGRAFVLPRVVPEARGRGAGSALLELALPYAHSLGCEIARSHVGGGDEHSLGFAARRGYAEVDRQVELVRDLLANEPPAVPPAGIALVEHTGDPEALRSVVSTGVEDMPVFGGLAEGFVDELLEELRAAAHVVTARENGAVVGVAGVMPYGARDDALEHAFTTVLRSHRGRGIATALKQACIRWSSDHGYAQLVTWTQDRNEAMQAVNDGVGFRVGKVSITVEGPLLARDLPG